MMQMGGSTNIHGSLGHRWAHVESTCANFSFPQAVGEDTVNTCWTGSDL
jgi:hypothetical protein